MELSPENKKYADQMGLAGVLYGCEPEGFQDDVTPEEMSAMSVYYFAGRDVDVDNMFDYKARIKADSPELVMLAERALRKVAHIYHVDENEIKKNA